MLTWISILTAHISFRRTCKAQGLPNSQLPYSAPFSVWGSSIALLFIGILIITKGVEVFIHGFGYKNFIVQYIGIPVYLISIFAYKSYYRTRRVRAGFANLVTKVPTENDCRGESKAERATSERGGRDGICSKYLAEVLSKMSFLALLGAVREVRLWMQPAMIDALGWEMVPCKGIVQNFNRSYICYLTSHNQWEFEG